MTATTLAGYRLAEKLNPYMGTTHQIVETCSLIARHAKTYNRIQEIWCSDEMSDIRREALEAQEEKLMHRIADLVADLPHADEEYRDYDDIDGWASATIRGPFIVQFDGDPRAYTVRLVSPSGKTEIGVA